MATQRRTPGSQTSLREANRARIVDAIKKHGGLTQVELAGATGLSAATVSNIVKELSTSGVLHTAQSIRSGRRAQHVTLAHALGLVVGVHFSTRHLRVALADVAHTVVAENHMPLARDHRADNELDKVSLLLNDMLESVDASRDDLLAVGLAVPAPIDRTSGTIARSGIMRGWDGVVIAESLERRIKRPVYLDNAANLGALGESRFGAGRGKRNFITLDIGDGIGAGLILNGQPYYGFLGITGELGHTPVAEHGVICRCGNRGCLETVASTSVMLESLGRGTGGGLSTADILRRGLAQDPAVLRVVSDAGTAIGQAIGNIANVINPELVLIGGPLVGLGDALLDPIRRGIQHNALPIIAGTTTVRVSSLGDRAESLGAAAIVIKGALAGND